MLKCFNQASNLLLSSSTNVSNDPLYKYKILLEIFRNKPFYFEIQEHNGLNCCFNHIIGLPTKNGIDKPLFDYQQSINDILQSYRHLWILKATGLGISEFFLRYMAWLCLRNNDYQNSQMVIVTGPNIDLAMMNFLLLT